MTDAPRILIVDDQRAVREELSYALRFEGYRTAEAEHGEAALQQLAAGDHAAVLLDIKMPGLDGLQVLARIKEAWPRLPVIMISGHGDIETAVVAVKSGAYDFLPKPFDGERVLVSVKNALRWSDLASENLSLREELAREYRLLGDSPPMQEVRRMIERVAPTEASVLITGENGTGKELVARQLHLLSRRAKAPFVALNCAAIPEELLESELFGHERGAFTGATGTRRGHFEEAHGGTLFLDEVGDLALDAQAKLLRALQERTITRVGGSKPIPVDVRLLAATNQDLQALVKEKRFREDLFYRLHVIRIHLPPLRERGADVEELAHHFVGQACRKNSLPRKKLGAGALAHLRTLPFPGNVRELRNLLEAAAILAEGPVLEEQDLRTGAATSAPGPAADEDWFRYATLEEFRGATEKEFIRRKIEENGGNIKRTAERIQIQRSNLYKKLERYGMK
jgi:two-component system nitrogen regulation response regulator NtrX